MGMAHLCACEFATFVMEATPEEADGNSGHPEIFPAKTLLDIIFRLPLAMEMQKHRAVVRWIGSIVIQKSHCTPLRPMVNHLSFSFSGEKRQAYAYSSWFDGNLPV